MNKRKLIEGLLDSKAKSNNTIDLNAYALGLDAMYEELVSQGIIDSDVQLYCGRDIKTCIYYKNGECENQPTECRDQVGVKDYKIFSKVHESTIKVGDWITAIPDDRIYTTYNLRDFIRYVDQPRNNNIRSGKVIDITPKGTILKTILVENGGCVVCVRLY